MLNLRDKIKNQGIPDIQNFKNTFPSTFCQRQNHYLCLNQIHQK